MARMKWLSEEGDQLFFEKYIERMESWKQAIADGQITLEEIKDQAGRVAQMLRELDELLDDDLHERVTQLLLEYAVLHALESAYLLQNAMGISIQHTKPDILGGAE